MTRLLQVKETCASVLEPCAGQGQHANHGQRVVAGQRITHTASDVCLGRARGANGREFNVRQLRDMKLSVVIEDRDKGLLRQYSRMCAPALAGARARSGDAAMVAGHAGSGQTFCDAIGEFAVDCSDQNRSDDRAFLRAIREGRIEALVEG